MTVHALCGVPRLVVKVSAADADPPDGTFRLDGLTPQLGHEAQSGGGEVVSWTVPLKLLTLATVIVEAAVCPGLSVWF